MIYCFDSDVAQEYGVNGAIMITNFQFWIAKNKACGKHFYDNHWWTYNSNKSMQTLFPFWSAKTIRTTFEHLREKGVIITGNYNNSPYDRTLWFAFADEEKWLCQNKNLDLPKSKNTFAEIGTPIPDINTDIIPDNNTPPIIPPQREEKLSFIDLWNKFADLYAKDYPVNQPIARIKSTTEIPNLGTRTKELNKLVKDLLSCDPDNIIRQELEKRNNDVWYWAFAQIWRKIKKSRFLRGECPTTDAHPKPFRFNVQFLMRKQNFIRMVSPNDTAFLD